MLSIIDREEEDDDDPMPPRPGDPLTGERPLEVAAAAVARTATAESILIAAMTCDILLFL